VPSSGIGWLTVEENVCADTSDPTKQAITKIRYLNIEIMDFYRNVAKVLSFSKNSIKKPSNCSGMHQSAINRQFSVSTYKFFMISGLFFVWLGSRPKAHKNRPTIAKL
jgi:hypothetical protein